MKILLLGADGQLGYELHRACAPLGEIHPFTYSGKLAGRQACGQVDFEKPGVLDALVREYKPAMVLNAVAHTAVDRAEDEPAIAQRVNADAVGELALACKREDAMLVHYSTDYVFDGRLRRPIREDDATGPVSVYGATKLAGEYLALAANPKTLVIRTCGLYGVHGTGGKGGNFVETMLRLAGQGKPLKVVDDQYCTPTATADLADATVKLLATGATGLFHITNAGATTWFQLAAEIFRQSQLNIDLTPITSAEFNAVARRPSYSVLDCKKVAMAGIRIREWPEAIGQYLSDRKSRKA